MVLPWLVLAGGLLLAACADPGRPLPVPERPISEIPAGRELTPVDPLASEIEHVDPRLEGWNTEAFNEVAGARLKELTHLIETSDAVADHALVPFVAPDFTCSLLRPTGVPEIRPGPGLSVRKGRPAGPSLSGPEGLARALRAVAAPFRGAAIRSKTKIISIEQTDDGFETRVLAQLWGKGENGPLQQNATWTVSWLPPEGEGPPLLTAIRLDEFDENSADREIFADCTRAVIGGEAAYNEQFLRGTDDWCARIDFSDFSARMNQYGHNGLAVGDIDNDGLEDVYILQSGGLPNRLFRQNPDGTATDISAKAGVDWLNESRAALFVDLDNDGAQDLVISTMRGILVMRGDGKGSFELKADLPTTQSYSLTAADVDGDRLLDVYACNYLQTGSGSALPAPYHDANNGPPNALYRNLGGFSFEDVTDPVGLDHNNRRFSYAATWVDFDEDGDLDLYVANDFGRNNLYRNDGGHFRDVAGAAGVEDMAAGMGTSWGDYNGDGHLDLYVSNMFSSAGRRITYQRRFNAAPGADARAFQRHARGNSLFANQGDGTFRDTTESAGVWMGRWAWGAEFVDLDNDGLEDIYVPNGFFTNEDTKDL